LRNDPALWHSLVPVSFHVDYWDHLGWRDRFASRVFTNRQYDYAKAWVSGSVYTPCFILNGKEWHPAGRQYLQADTGAVGRLRFDWNGRDRIKVVFEPSGEGGAFDAYVALLGGGLSSKVTAGENSGEELAHEFVALSLVRIPLAETGKGAQSAERDWTATPPTTAGRLAVAIWVTRAGDIDPVQATGGWIK
jgi:hypothetical protein